VEPTRQEFLYLSAFEKYLFYTLVYLSLAIMLWQILGRAKVWRQGKPIWWGEPLKTAWKGWFSNVWVLILGQRKVRGSRKRSGAPMHLLLFYGFLTLFIGTVILAINTYSPFKSHQPVELRDQTLHGVYFLTYEMVLDVMGTLFVVGVVWAFFRRLKMTHAELGPAGLQGDSADAVQVAKQEVQGRRRPLSGSANDLLTLGLLFMLGFTGFLLEGARMAATPHTWDWSAPVGRLFSEALGRISPDWYRGIWWFHMAWIYVLFITIPRMRIRHIVMAILSSAGKPPQPIGELKPIAMEEVELTGQIGVALAKDYSRWHLMSLDACMECGRCTEVCPAWNVGKLLNPKQIVQDIRGAMVSGETIEAAVSEEALWACTTCNACVEACPVLIRHVDLIVDSRRNLVAEGKLSGSGATMLRQTASTSNAWGAPASSREDWMKGLDIPLCRDGVQFEYLFWVGCAGATDPGAVKTTKAVAQLLKKAGVSFACLGQEEACTGDPARRIGDEFLFQEKAMENISVFQRYKVQKVVTPCPHCFNTLSNEYGQFEGQLNVVHHSQLLQELIAAGKLKASNSPKGEVTYHDPCYLARINNESDAPRAVLGEETTLNDHNPEALELGSGTAKEQSLVEPKHFGRKTLCCGAGGGRMWMEEPPSQRPGNRRAQELLDTGAKTVAVGCPFCRIMLDASIKQVTDDEIRLVDLAEMLQEANA
jgi:Fe-S oxidoreductase